MSWRRLALWSAVVVGVLAVGVAGYWLGKDRSSDSTASTTATPNEQAAGGPLVGDPTLVSEEQTCVKDNSNEPWFATIAAFEVHDSARTHLYACAHFLGSVSSTNEVLAYRSTDVYETPYNIVTAGPDNLFIYGGGYGDSSSASGSFVSSVEPGTLDERWRRVLINTNSTDEWDYPGVLNVLADGSLVVIHGYHIARLNPATGAIEASRTLPTGKSAPRDTSAQNTSWGPVPYLKSGQTAGSAMAAMGDYVVAMTNGGAPTSTPMSVVAVAQADSSEMLNLEPFADSDSDNSFIPSMVSVDPAAGQIYVMDAGAGKIGAVALKNGKLSLVWSDDQTTLSFTTLVGPQGQRVLIGTDIPVRFFKQLRNYSTEQVVWRDAATGKELARSDEFPKMSAGILVTPGYAGLQYFLTADGHIVALQVDPSSAD